MVHVQTVRVILSPGIRGALLVLFRLELGHYTVPRRAWRWRLRRFPKRFPQRVTWPANAWTAMAEWHGRRLTLTWRRRVCRRLRPTALEAQIVGDPDTLTGDLYVGTTHAVGMVGEDGLPPACIEYPHGTSAAGRQHTALVETEWGWTL
jgi:hypothetical protein